MPVGQHQVLQVAHVSDVVQGKVSLVERDIAKKAAAYFAQDTLRGTPGFTK